MRYLATLLVALLPAAILAAPTDITARDVEPCAPTEYTLSDYFLTYSSQSAHVEFDFKSTFPDPSIIEDPVVNGATCSASGPTLPNNNECAVPDRKLLFDLAGEQTTGRYQIIHTWRCNSSTWMSSTPVQIENLICETDGSTGVTECHGQQSQVITPQNVRQICNTPTCP